MHYISCALCTRRAEDQVECPAQKCEVVVFGTAKGDVTPEIEVRPRLIKDIEILERIQGRATKGSTLTF